MMDLRQFEALALQIEQLGYPPETAADFAAAIGDTPELDADGLVVVRDATGAVVARLSLPGFLR